MVVCQVLLLTLRFESGQTSEIAEPARFSLLQSYFCMLSGEHRAICMFNDTCSYIPVGEASKENVPEEVGLWLGLFTDLWLTEPPWMSLSSWHQGDI